MRSFRPHRSSGHSEPYLDVCILIHRYVEIVGNVDRLSYHLFGWKYFDHLGVALDELVDAHRAVRS